MDDQNDGREAWYPFDKLEVYHLAVRFRALVKEILKQFPQIDPDDADQVSRSSKSSIRNICEAAGEFRPHEKARFYRMSARSASESGGTLRLIQDDAGPHPLFREAHAVNCELFAKLIVLSKKKGQ